MLHCMLGIDWSKALFPVSRFRFPVSPSESRQTRKEASDQFRLARWLGRQLDRFRHRKPRVLGFGRPTSGRPRSRFVGSRARDRNSPARSLAHLAQGATDIRERALVRPRTSGRAPANARSRCEAGDSRLATRSMDGDTSRPKRPRAFRARLRE